MAEQKPEVPDVDISEAEALRVQFAKSGMTVLVKNTLTSLEVFVKALLPEGDDRDKTMKAIGVLRLVLRVWLGGVL